MWETEATATTSASPEAVWERWSDVANWKQWDQGVEWSRQDGAFATGARGILKPKSGPATPFTLVRVEPGRGFTDHSRLPLATLIFDHEAVPEGGQTRITHRVQIVGPLAGLFVRLMGRGLAAGLPEAVRSLARAVEGV